jgi:hypothetical protein
LIPAVLNRISAIATPSAALEAEVTEPEGIVTELDNHLVFCITGQLGELAACAGQVRFDQAGLKVGRVALNLDTVALEGGIFLREVSA